MNNQQLNNLVAEAIGLDEWVIVKNGYYYRPDACGYTSNLSEAWKVPLETAKRYEMYADNPKVPFYEKVLIQKAPTPDFGRDLNEMRKAENTLDDEKLWKMDAILFNMEDCRAPFNASAKQKREAFLKVLELI